MKKLLIISLLSVLLIVVISFFFTTPIYAWLQNYEIESYSYIEYGFFSGIWHGLMAPFAVFAQIFDNDIVLYSSINTGFGYNIGFLIGISAIIGGGSRATCKDKENEEMEEEDE